MGKKAYIEIAISFGGMLSPELLTSASQCQRSQLLLLWLSQTESRRQHIRRGTFNKYGMSRCCYEFSTVWTLPWLFHFCELQRWQLLTVQGIRKEKEPSFPIGGGASELSPSKPFHHPRTGEWIWKTKCFSLSEAVGIRDSISLGGLHRPCISWE